MRRESTITLFLTYTAVRALLCVALGLSIAAAVRSTVHTGATRTAADQAHLVAGADVVPALGGRPLSGAMSASTRASLLGYVTNAVAQGQLLGLRLENAAGRTVFADVAGPSAGAATASTPIVAGVPPRRLGTLIATFPAGAIATGAASGLGDVNRDLALGLSAMFIALLGISLLVNAGFRRQIRARTYLAGTDPLTDLPNRSVFQRRASAAVGGESRGDRATTVAIIDLDHFKVINDTLGHDVGDELLAELGSRLSAGLRPGDTVARLGGDEFGLVLRDCDDPERALWRVRDTIEQEVTVSGLPLSVDASIGYVAAGDGAGIDALMQRAEIAMYEAKTRHAGVLRYDASQDHYNVETLSLAGELRHAIEHDQLVLHYQPKARLANRRTEAVEALVRWQHPTRGSSHRTASCRSPSSRT